MNIAEILKYCPKGTKLYSLVDGEVTLKNISDPDEYPIKVVTYNGDTKYYTKDGLFFTNRPGGNCCNNSNYDPELIMDSYITDLVKDKLKIYTKRFVQELNEEIERLNNVINDLLDYE